MDCHDATDVRETFIFCQLVVAIAIIVGLSFTARRKRLWPDVCDGRPGVLHPINLIDDYGRRWPFIVCYVVVTNDILALYVNGTMSEHDAWTAALIQLMSVLTVCVVYYPLFVCLTNRRHIAANIVGFCYVLAIFIMAVWWTVSCTTSTGVGEVDYQALTFQLPVIVSSAVLLITYAYDFKCNAHVMRGFCQGQSVECGQRVDEVGSGVDDMEYLVYVQNLLKKRRPPQPRPVEPPSSFTARLTKNICNWIDRNKYKPVVGFRYPLSLICTLTVCVLLICVMVVAVQFLINILFKILHSTNLELNDHKLISERTSRIVKGTLTMANILAGLIHLGFLVHMLTTYRRNVLEHFSGKQRSHLKLFESPSTVLIRAMSYPGYQMVACLYGFAFIFILFFMALMCFVYLVIVPIQDNERNWIIDATIRLCPSAVFSVGIFVIQFLLCKFVFLQDNGHVIGLQNRRLFHIMSFYLFIFNFVVGFFMCALRLTMSQVFSMLFVSRLDFVYLVENCQRLDIGHQSYLSMVVLDMYQNHPVLRTFIHLLRTSKASRSKETRIWTQGSLKDTDEKNPATEALRRRRLRARWLKLLTMINNPSLIADRLQRQWIQQQKANPEAGDMTSQLTERCREVNGMFRCTGKHLQLDLVNITASFPYH